MKKKGGYNRAKNISVSSFSFWNVFFSLFLLLLFYPWLSGLRIYIRIKLIFSWNSLVIILFFADNVNLWSNSTAIGIFYSTEIFNFLFLLLYVIRNICMSRKIIINYDLFSICLDSTIAISEDSKILFQCQNIYTFNTMNWLDLNLLFF